MTALDDSQFNMMAEKLYVAVISDILDGMGFRGQVLQPGVVPAQPDPSQVLVGRVATMLVGLQYEVVDQPYTNQIAAIDALKPGDVVVIPAGTGHQFTKIDDHIDYLMVRIDPDKVTPLKSEAQSKEYLSKPAPDAR